MPAPAALDSTQRRQLFWLFALALLVLGAGYGLRDPWPADEPRFVLVAKQMVDSGQWLFPHRGHELYPDKPPVFFWLLAASHWLIGNWRWSFLLPSLLSGFGTLWLVYDLGRRLWNHRAGLWAAIAILSSLQFVYQFKRAQIDPTLVLFTTLALYGLCRHLLLGPHWRWFWGACVAAGIGVILKGVGFLPLFALLPFALMQRGRWQGLAPLGTGNGWRWSAGPLLFLAAIALWLVPMLWFALAGGDPEHRAYLDNLLFKQTATRYAEAWHHHKPAWYFAEVMALFWLPFSLAFAWLWRDWRDAWRRRDARVWLPLAWALLVLAFFSASPGKRDMYILPALPAVALAAAPFLDALVQRRNFQRALLTLCVLLGALLLGLGIAALQLPLKPVQALIVERGLGDEARWLWLMLAAVGAIGLVAAAWFRRTGATRAMACLLLAMWCGYGFVAHPVLDPSSSAAALMRDARERAGPDVSIGLVAWKEQNLLQAVGPTEEFGYKQPAELQLQRAVAWLDQDASRRRVFFSQPRGRTTCFDGVGHDVEWVGTANRRDWYLVTRAAIGERCFDSGAEDQSP
ncbi:MAG: glycosyltransferase family 39 protein [Arenimonas sp.]|jgi:4-amino-4-deoxy-L-arabinose transferase-like glycosyltransferase